MRKHPIHWLSVILTPWLPVATQTAAAFERPAPELIFGGTGDDAVGAMLPHPQGAFLAGWTTPEGSTAADFWLVSVDAAGNRVRETSFPAPGDDRAFGMAAGKDGGVVLVGACASGDGDARVVAVSADGRLLWERTHGGAERQSASAVARTSAGYVLAGETYASGTGRGDGWLVGLDSAGGLLWQEAYGGDRGERFFAVVTAAAGGFAAAGVTSSGGAGAGDMWLVRTDPDGRLLWEWSYGGPGPDAAYALVATPDGGFLLAGDTLASPESHDGDGLVVKTDPTGIREWSRKLGSFDLDRLGALAPLPGGGYVLGGTSLTKGIEGRQIGALPVAWLVVMDAAGLLRGEQASQLGGTSVIRALTSLPDGSILAGGSLHSAPDRPSQAWLGRLDTAPTCSGSLDTASHGD
jgi:hypothetical protein